MTLPTTSPRPTARLVVSLVVNGREHAVEAPPHETLLSVLRDRLSLTGTKLVCDRGECGACTVLLDGEPVYACLTLAAACAGQRVTTIEGLAAAPGAAAPRAMHPLQEAFIRHDAVQCGFCTPGQLLAGAALLARTAGAPSDEEIAEAMSGNLCRCGTYPKIVRAIRDAGETMRQGGQARAEPTAHG
jgi:aerobic-type carbon monoxide dehydrogenase small subunit (CoxS/CutS family)